MASALLALEDDVEIVGSVAALIERLRGATEVRLHKLVTEDRKSPTMTDESIRAATELSRAHQHPRAGDFAGFAAEGS
ncbi:MAG: hypothetical protein ABJA74_01885 [Lapillicoccus sp.]